MNLETLIDEPAGFPFVSLQTGKRARAGLLLALIVWVFLPPNTVAQGFSGRIVEVETNMPDAMVYADSVYIGRASDRVFAIPRETSSFRLVPPTLDSWSMAPLVTELSEHAADTLALEMRFKYHYRIESIPYDSQVFLESPGERTLLGDTPLLYAVDDPIRGMLLVTKSGYDPLRMTPGEKIWNQHYITLETEIEDQELARTFWKPGNRSGRWIDVVAGGVAVASGILAVRYKTKADRRYSRYEQSGDPALRPGFERYDTYSALALGTMQVGLGVIALRFIID